jgi:hypothetical protein
MEQGCSEGMRDEAAFRIACYFREKEIPQKLAETSMDTWNRQNQPPLEDDDLNVKIESAYSADYPYRPCHLPAFDSSCHSACAFFERKVQNRWFSKDTSPIGVISRD